MKRTLAAFLLVCACGPGGAPEPEPVPEPQGAAASDTTLAEPEPLVTWGPRPPGEAHAPRQRVYDLQHQVVRVRFDWDRHAVVGSTTLHVAPLDGPLTRLAFDAERMTIEKVTSSDGAELKHEYDGHTLVVRLPEPLQPDRVVSVTVDYETVAPEKGVYFIDRAGYVWTHGEPHENRHWIPTYDYPNDKTTWEFYIHVPEGIEALSNGRLVERRPVDGAVIWHWKLDQPASTYLMMAALGDYEILRDSAGDVPLGYWTYPDSVEAGWRGMGMTPDVMEVFENAIGVPYPWDKYDQVVVPDFIYGGMENVTASTLNDDRTLHPAHAEPQADASGLIAHELAHQWYGDLLTLRDWSEAWLNEGFAAFMGHIYSEARDPAAGAGARRGAQQGVIRADLRNRRPLVYDRWQEWPFELFFSGHVYAKGAAVLHMLRHQLGDSLFWAGIQRYTRRNAFGNVTSADLRRALEETSGRDLREFFDDWVYGAGFPVFRVTHEYDPGSTTLTVRAREVQPRDSLTGFFDPAVDIEVLTDSGPVRGVLQVRNGSGQLALTLPAPPRSIRWDKGGWLLDVAHFPRPTQMLIHQLQHDDDVIGRMDALDLLAQRTGEPEAVAAIAEAAGSDPYWSAREIAVRYLGGMGDDAAVIEALLAAIADPDPRVRSAAAAALAGFSEPGVAARLEALAREDTSHYVRAAAVEALAQVDPEAALPVIRSMAREDSWQNRLRRAAIGAAVHAAEGRESEIRALLESLLPTDDPAVRRAVESALERMEG